MTKPSLEELHKMTLQNKELLKKASHIGCFSCGNRIEYKDIEFYIDRIMTAICPYCSVDSLIPLDSRKENEQDKLLKDMHEYYS